MSVSSPGPALVPAPALIRLTAMVLLSFCIISETTADDSLSFSRDVLPILSDKCFVCHGPDSAESGDDLLRLDSFEGVTADRGGYRAIDPEHPADSRLLARIHSADDPMPPATAEKQLTSEERATLTRWVEQGGAYAVHSAFVRPQKAAVPARPGSDSAIDAWIEEKLSESGLSPAPEADTSTLARRLALVLTGLPPEPQQLRVLLDDPSPTAWTGFLDDLLASPRYGEHQARYWLDAVRYGDTHGLHLDNRRGIYPWRDWIVRALNRNMPLDQFIVWQLAGDLLPDPTLEQRVASGFVRMNPTTSEGGAIPEEFQAKNNFDRVETLGTVLLGMTLTCARCHTHKYDPIPQTEYYELLAFFNSTAEHSMDGNKYDYGPVVRAPADHAAWDAWEELERSRAGLVSEASEWLMTHAGIAAETKQRWDDADPAGKLTMLADGAGGLNRFPGHEGAVALAEQLARAEEQFTTTLVAEELAKPRATYLLRRGEYNLPSGEPLQPDAPSIMGPLPAGAPRNRLGLAMWLTSRDHPLVARVLVNRLWQQVFGYGLVRTPEDFGLQGQQPTHPELLDWLAVELQDSGWDLKHMLRLMVTSRTFRQSSAWRSDVEDPENRLFARGSSYRLDAEVIRDVGLWASGLLDPTMGGEGVKPYQPPGLWKALAHPASNTKLYERDHGQRLYRRSLYVYWKRTSPHPMMTLFDAPDRESSCVRRSRTNTSLQSLGLLNETQRIEMARTLARRLLQENGTDETRLETLYGWLTSRPPTVAEADICRDLLAAMRERYRDGSVDAQALLAIGDAPRDDSLAAADAAAWTQVCATVLASDAAIMLY